MGRKNDRGTTDGISFQTVAGFIQTRQGMNKLATARHEDFKRGNNYRNRPERVDKKYKTGGQNG